MFVEVDVGVTAKVASNELGDGFSRHNADRLVFMATDERLQGISHPLHGLLNVLTPGGADRQWRFEPLAKDFEMPALQLIELKTLPQALVEVAEVVDPLGTKAEHPSDSLGRADHALGGAAVEGRKREVGEALGEGSDFDATSIGERDIQDTLHAVLFVVNRRAGADQDHLGHVLDAASAGRADTPPRSVPRRAPSVNSPKAVA